MKTFASKYASLGDHLTDIRHGNSRLTWEGKTELSQMFGMKLDGAGQWAIDETISILPKTELARDIHQGQVAEVLQLRRKKELHGVRSD